MEKDKESGEAEKGMVVNFTNYVASLGFQAVIYMGEMPNPVSDKIEKNLKQARFLLDTLIMMQKKTEGNLVDSEKDLLNKTIYELELKYAEVNKEQ